MIPAHSNPAYYPARPVLPPPVVKKQVRFVSDDESSSDSDTDSLWSSDSETSVTSSGSWPEHDATAPIIPKTPILDFRNPAFGKFFDTIDVDSPEAQRIASLDLVRFEANLQLILRTSNVTFSSAAGLRPRGHRPLPSRNEAIAIARAALELREAIRAIEPLLARMHRCGLDIKEMAKCLRSTKKVLDILENDEADLLERGMRPTDVRRPTTALKKPTSIEVSPLSTRNASPPRSQRVAQGPAPSTTSAAPPTSSSTREPSPPRTVRRKPVPEAFPREQTQPVVAATPNPTPSKSLAAAVVHTKAPPPASTSTPPKKRNHLPVAASPTSPAPAPHRAPLSPVYPSITIEGPTPTNPPIALPVAYQSVPAYPSRTNVPERSPSPRVVAYRRVSWPESDGRGGYVVPVSQGHITASHVARC